MIPSALAKELYETKNKNKNIKAIKNRWINLKHEIKKMSEEEKKLNNQIKY